MLFNSTLRHHVRKREDKFFTSTSKAFGHIHSSTSKMLGQIPYMNLENVRTNPLYRLRKPKDRFRASISQMLQMNRFFTSTSKALEFLKSVSKEWNQTILINLELMKRNSPCDSILLDCREVIIFKSKGTWGRHL